MKSSTTALILIALTLILMAGCTAGSRNQPPDDPALSTVEGTASSSKPTGETLELPTETSPSAVSPTPIRPPSEQNHAPNEISDRDYSDLDIVTLLPPDAIPALTFPDYYSVEDADEEYLPEELVIGVDLNGDARAYSVGLLSRHEIVNDTVGGVPLSVTW